MSKKRSRKRRSEKRTKQASPVAAGQNDNKSSNASLDSPQSSAPPLRSWQLVLGLSIVALVAVVAFLNFPNLEQASSKPSTNDQKVSDTVSGPARPDQLMETSIQLPTAPGLDQQKFDSVVRKVAEREDPVLDGWQSERFNELASGQLKTVGEFISDPGKMKPELVAKIAAKDFSSTGLRPDELEEVFSSDPSLRVFRGEVGETTTKDGHGSFQTLVEELAAPLLELPEKHFKFKIIRVDQQPDHTETTAYFQISGNKGTASTQINSTWVCRWSAANEPPLLQDIRVERYEEVVYQDPSGPMFADCTESMFRNTDRFQRQLIYGLDHWTDRFDGAIARPAAGHGIAIGDVNGDGLEDAYVCQSPALPNLLLIQNPDGTVRDTALEAGVSWLEGTRSALLADLDNDGDQDLVTVLGAKVVIQANDGTGNFTMKTIVSTPSSLFQINAVDYDGDRDLDLFVCGYTLTSGIDLNDVFANPVPFQDASNGAPNVMLRNDGGWAFTDVTKDVGLGQNNSRFSYASAWDDFDNDGDQDVYVANDFGRNNLYRNDDGMFVDVAHELDVEDIGPGMSASWGDFNNDGNADIYVSNMFSSAGNRITSQKQFKSDFDEETKQHFRRHARGNSLFENTGDGSFRDRSVELGVTIGRWAWGSLFVDINNDGWEDLYVANGFVTADDNDDL